MIAVGQGNEYETESLWGRAALLAAPYMGVDGMNEKGLTASLLDVDFGEEHMHTDNPDLTVTMAIRLLLDRAATVSEAVELLRGYDIHTGHGWTQHIFVADANGDAAVIEWHNEKMRVTESPVCTNFRMSNKTFEGNYKGACERFDLLAEALEKQPRNTAEDSLSPKSKGFLKTMPTGLLKTCRRCFISSIPLRSEFPPRSPRRRSAFRG